MLNMTNDLFHRNCQLTVKYLAFWAHLAIKYDTFFLQINDDDFAVLVWILLGNRLRYIQPVQAPLASSWSSRLGYSTGTIYSSNIQYHKQRNSLAWQKLHMKNPTRIKHDIAIQGHSRSCIWRPPKSHWGAVYPVYPGIYPRYPV